jgi:hypothetical protein
MFAAAAAGEAAVLDLHDRNAIARHIKRETGAQHHALGRSAFHAQIAAGVDAAL